MRLWLKAAYNSIIKHGRRQAETSLLSSLTPFFLCGGMCVCARERETGIGVWHIYRKHWNMHAVFFIQMFIITIRANRLTIVVLLAWIILCWFRSTHVFESIRDPAINTKQKKILKRYFEATPIECLIVCDIFGIYSFYYYCIIQWSFICCMK